ncbi:hypothetical protein ABTH15_19950, partial [Acinetobacter baumannii]
LSAATSVSDNDVTVIDQSGTTLKIARSLLVGSGNNDIAPGSAAFGYNNTSTGDTSVAVGVYDNRATGSNSVAVGVYNNSA